MTIYYVALGIGILTGIGGQMLLKAGADAPDFVGLMTDADSLHHTTLIAEALRARAPGLLICAGGPTTSPGCLALACASVSPTFNPRLLADPGSVSARVMTPCSTMNRAPGMALNRTMLHAGSAAALCCPNCCRASLNFAPNLTGPKPSNDRAATPLVGAAAGAWTAAGSARIGVPLSGCLEHAASMAVATTASKWVVRTFVLSNRWQLPTRFCQSYL